ncbi:STAS domain-containing protein [Dasania marina]|uniref:STAS domain-containing protein n=1 Tax=Dasania marina TaxID=471499 RepID=UPI000375BE8D|nr:STAS domain-containing protein [Dasania marina]
MPITSSQQGQDLTITLDESFNFDAVENFREAYSDKDAEVYIVDFRATEYMDSSGLGMLLNMKRYLSEKNINTIKLINCRQQIKKVLIISRFESKFIIT